MKKHTDCNHKNVRHESTLQQMKNHFNKKSLGNDRIVRRIHILKLNHAILFVAIGYFDDNLNILPGFDHRLYGRRGDNFTEDPAFLGD